MSPFGLFGWGFALAVVVSIYGFPWGPAADPTMFFAAVASAAVCLAGALATVNARARIGGAVHSFTTIATIILGVAIFAASAGWILFFRVVVPYAPIAGAWMLGLQPGLIGGILVALGLRAARHDAPGTE